MPGGSVTANVTPQIVSKMFPFTPIGNIRTNLSFVLKALDDISRFNTSAGGHPFDLYDNRTELGNHGPPDGASFKGRGFVQLTGRSNYTKFSKELGLGAQLVTQPDLANDATIAAKLLARFLKDKEAAIRRALANHDLKTARRLVNGGVHGYETSRTRSRSANDSSASRRKASSVPLLRNFLRVGVGRHALQQRRKLTADDLQALRRSGERHVGPVLRVVQRRALDVFEPQH